MKDNDRQRSYYCIRSNKGEGVVKKVLVVDDDRDYRVLLEQILIRDKFQVIHACSGQEAVNILAQQSVCLLISDLRMPNGDGWLLLSTLREKNLKTMPVIMNSSDLVIEEIRLRELGADAVFSKSLVFNSLIPQIRKLLGKG